MVQIDPCQIFNFYIILFLQPENMHITAHENEQLLVFVSTTTPGSPGVILLHLQCENNRHCVIMADLHTGVRKKYRVGQ